MLSLIDREWKAFIISDLFDIDLSKGDNQPSLLEGGIYPLISAGTKNNGVCAYIKEGDGKSQLFDKNTITVDMFGTPFYHSYSYYAVSHGRVNMLKPKIKFNKYIGLFIISTINEGVKNKYSYNQMCSQKRLSKQPIMLPITEDGTPDYGFMEQYIREREEKLALKYKTFISNKCQIGGVIPKLNSKKWNEFFIGEICEIHSGCDIYDAERFDGNTPYITSSSVNNGIKYFVGNTNGTFERNCISVNRNGSVGFSFYHKYSALYSNDCRKLKLKQYNNEYVALFICNQIMKQKEKYNYSIKMGTSRLKKQKILLPIKDDGTVDYEYMASYSKAVMYQKYKKYLEYKR